MTLGTREQYERALHEFESSKSHLWDLEAKLSREILEPHAKSLVGTIWRFRNSFSLPKDESHYWWKYRIFVACEPGMFFCHQFQIDRYGELTIQIRHEIPWISWFGNGINYPKENPWEQVNIGDNSLRDDWGDAISMVHKLAKSLE